MTNISTEKKLETALVISRLESSEIKRFLKKSGFKIVNSNPDLIVCYGGDGTILYAEMNFPQIPKLIIKKSRICRKCDYSLHDIGSILGKIRAQRFKLQKEMKLETVDVQDVHIADIKDWKGKGLDLTEERVDQAINNFNNGECEPYYLWIIIPAYSIDI